MISAGGKWLFVVNGGVGLRSGRNDVDEAKCTIKSNRGGMKDAKTFRDWRVMDVGEQRFFSIFSSMSALTL